jgi:hypothetical protein
MAINDGGPAFPDQKRRYVAGYATSEYDPVPGMTMRDYFAAKALGGMLASEEEGAVYSAKNVAERAYEMADAMLAARA